MILNLIKYIFSLPLYWLSFFIKKDKKLWVFGAWAGQRYSDNSRYIFEYVHENETGIRAVWLTRNPNILNDLRSRGYETYSIVSIKGFIIGSRAVVYFFTDSLFDVGQLSSGRGLKFQLWHGVPLKKIGYDSNIKESTKKKVAKFFSFSK